MTFNKQCTIPPYNSVLTSYNERTNEVTYLFDGYGPSTPYTVSFILNALCLITGFPWLQRNKTRCQCKEQTGNIQGRWGGCVCVSCALNSSVCVCVCQWSACRCVVGDNIKLQEKGSNKRASRTVQTYSSTLNVQYI